MTQLHKLSHEMEKVKGLLGDGVPAEAINDTLEGLDLEFKDKAEKMLFLVSNMQSDVDQIDKEIERLTDKKRVVNNNQNQLKEYLRSNMEATGIDKIECPLFRITLKKALKVVVIDDQDDLDDEFIKVDTEITADKKAIAAAIKEGREVIGAHLEDGKRALLIK